MSEKGFESEIANIGTPNFKETEEKPLKKQTGPARRGDLTIIENHIDSLSGDKEFQALYKELSQYILSEFHGEKYKL